ncbi:unnamed protein product, partial [Hapterophycus canaliculatus]
NKEASERKDDKSSDGKDKKEKGEWNMLTDAYGRLYWQHSVTGEWSYVYGGGVASPVGTVAQAPMAYPGGATVFTPSPPPMVTVNPPPMVYPGGAAVFTPSPVYPVAPAKKKAEGKKKEAGKTKAEEKGRGWWETKYDDEGIRYWEHTKSNKTTYKDPYF